MLTPKEEIILALLQGSQKRYGLELVKASKGKLPRGTVYVFLKRLQDKGFINSELRDSEAGKSGPPRRVYWLTGQGATALKAWNRYQAAQGKLKPGVAYG